MKRVVVTATMANNSNNRKTTDREGDRGRERHTHVTERERERRGFSKSSLNPRALISVVHFNVFEKKERRARLEQPRIENQRPLDLELLEILMHFRRGRTMEHGWHVVCCVSRVSARERE